MIKIECVGIDFTHDKDFVCISENQDWWLLLHIKSSSQITLPDGNTTIAPPNTAVLYPPHSDYFYRACDEIFCNSFIRFYTDEEYITNTSIPFGTPFTLRAPDSVYHLFSLLSAESYFEYPNKELTIAMLMRMIMIKMSESIGFDTGVEHMQELTRLRYDILLRPEHPWTVSEMADILHVSKGYLQRLYKKQFGVTCMNDVMQSRVERAKELLKTSNYSAQRIAELCGYESQEHFCRQFKKLTGMTPTKYKQASIRRQ